MEERKPVVLVSGATGQIGVFLLPRLVAQGDQPIAISRRAAAAGEVRPTSAKDGVHWINPDDYPDPVNLDRKVFSEPRYQWLHRVSCFYSCGPIEMATHWATLCPKLDSIICISTSSIYTKANSPARTERDRMADILAAEDALKALCREREIRLVLLRPTLIYGCGMDQNISLIAHWVKRLPVIPVAGKASGLRQPLHAEDLATIMLRCADSEIPGLFESPVVGGETLSYRAMVSRVCRALGRSPRLVSVPVGLLKLAVQLLSLWPSARSLNPQFVTRQNIDLVFDDAALKQFTGFTPRPFHPTGADFDVPVSALNRNKV